MADDLYVRLQKALDEAEQLASRAASLCGCHPPASEWSFDEKDDEGRILIVDDPHPQIRRKLSRRWNGTYDGLFAASHIARWDPNTVLRLIERDRKLLAEYQRELDVTREWLDEEAVAEVRRAWQLQLDSAAEFWLTDTETIDG